MFPWMIGKEYPATTVVIQYQAMNPITVNAVTEIIVAVAVHTARCVTPQYASDVHMNVPHVMNQFVKAAQLNAKNAKRYSANNV